MAGLSVRRNKSGMRTIVAALLGLGACLGCRSRATPSQQSPSRAVASTLQPNPSKVTGSVDTTPRPSPANSEPPSAGSGPSPDALALEDTDFVFPKSAQGERVAFILLLHGLGGSGPLIRHGLEFDRFAEQDRFAFAAPSGPIDRQGRRYWNAPLCCDFDRVGLDHMRILTELLQRASQDPRIDPARLFVYGFSNGGYMAHHLACAGGFPLAGIVSVAGVPPARNDKCRPQRRLTVIQVHGRSDVTVPMQGGHLFGDPKYPAIAPLMQGMNHWAAALGCQEMLPHQTGQLDLEARLSGEETIVHQWGHCRGTLTLFEIAGGTHLSVNAAGITKHVLESLLASK